MKKFLILASLGALTLTSVAAQAEHNWRKRKFLPQQDRVIYYYEDDVEDDGFVSYEDDEDDVIYINPRKRRMREAEQEIDAELWWLEENARKKLENRNKARKAAIKKADAKKAVSVKKTAAASKSIVKPKTVAAAKPAQTKLQTASLSKPVIVTKPKPVSEKTIGCTAGAAVVTGYGFGEVKPKACTGTTYAYTAARAGKIYEIKMTAASGEIVDVKKLN